MSRDSAVDIDCLSMDSKKKGGISKLGSPEGDGHKNECHGKARPQRHVRMLEGDKTIIVI